ncbi:nucleoside triphosphate hydrolase [Rhodobacter sp. KR11]|uniref:nucleoside triphosphate hydrolase n=1 Tax=Rhodobacter sp. KR11 TaxID=2974588 RepID=UPI002222900F|nr:nucleoside triphosphate hydrolase [Rhodobacter sp. KR11]MCW1919082.1 nucleoside triphosphate hydrolase [Rhodobacter sp. KR11]
MTPQALAELILDQASAKEGRFIAALAGPPGAGKSTLAQALVGLLGPSARVVPMDGFHFDDAILNARGMRARKGAPETFDVAGYRHLLTRLTQEDEVAIPVFDRSLELSRGSADLVTQDHRILVTEGNYLLLDEAPWTDLAAFFDLTVMIDVPEEELDRRLLARWDFYGKTPVQARAWIDGNDMPNIRRVTRGSRDPDVTIRWG